MLAGLPRPLQQRSRKGVPQPILNSGAAFGRSGQTGWYPESRENLTLDERLKELMQELGHAINESLSDSDRIAEAIGEIKRAGYDVFLVLEATIGFNKREGNGEEGDTETVVETRLETDFEEEVAENRKKSRERRTGRIRWTAQDQKFLRALKIAIDEDNA
jgi:hypothetical protein